MLRTLILLLIIVPLAIVFVAFAVANRHDVTLLLDPTRSIAGLEPDAVTTELASAAIYFQPPLWVALFVAMIVGLVIGWLASVASHVPYRREARRKRREADEWHRRADREHEIAERERERADLYAPQDATSDAQRRRRPLGALPAPSN